RNAPIIPTIILLKHPIRELFLVSMLAIQPASAPKTIQESQLKFDTTGSILRFLLITLNYYQTLLGSFGFGTIKENISPHNTAYIILTNLRSCSQHVICLYT